MLKKLSSEVEAFKDIDKAFEKLQKIQTLARDTQEFEVVYQSKYLV
jgi:hypothetical protein